MGFGRNSQNARTRLWTRGSQTVVAFVHAAKKRRRAILVSAGVLLLVAVVVAIGSFRYLQAEAAAAVVNGYGSLSQCLLGPADNGETKPSVRYRAIQLTALTQSDVARNKKDSVPWPDRCARHAHVLQEGVAASAIADSPAGKNLQVAAGQLATALEKKDNHGADLSAPVDALFGAAAAAGINAAAVADIPAPPAAAKVATLDSLKGIFTSKRVDLAAIDTPALAGGSTQILVTDAGVDKGPFVCTIKPGKANCKTIKKPAAAATKLSLDGGSDNAIAPLLFSKDGVFRASNGALVSNAAANGGHLRADGIVDLIRSDGRSTSWSRVDKQRERKMPIFVAGMSVADPAHDIRMFGEHVMMIASKKDSKQVLAARIESARLSRPTMAAELSENFEAAAQNRLTACRAGRNDVVRVVGKNSSQLLFWQGSKWSAPVKAMPGRGALGCHGASAILGRYRTGAQGQLSSKLDIDTCTAEGCKRTSEDMRSLLSGEVNLVPAASMEVASIGEVTIIAWLAQQRGGVRVRVAAADELGNAPDVIAFDDLMSAGKVASVSTLSDMRVLTGDGYAVLLLGTSAGLRAMTVDDKGRVEPVAVTWQ